MLTLREVQLAELNILEKATDFLDKNGIRYSLAYGTLLGAIRHNGFIPWDDDIDILIPREDYEKLKMLVKNGGGICDNIVFRVPGDKGYKYPFVKAVDLSYKVQDTNQYVNGYSEHLWVDIFPLNHVPNNMKRFKFQHIIIKFFGKITQYDVLRFNKKGLKSNLFKLIAKLLAFLVGGYRNVTILADKISYKLHKKHMNSDYLADGAWGRAIRFPRKCMQEYEMHAFENSDFCIFKEYDELLRIMYSNYMEIPPIEKRQTHLITVYKNDSESV